MGGKDRRFLEAWRLFDIRLRYQRCFGRELFDTGLVGESGGLHVWGVWGGL